MSDVETSSVPGVVHHHDIPQGDAISNNDTTNPEAPPRTDGESPIQEGRGESVVLDHVAAPGENEADPINTASDHSGPMLEAELQDTPSEAGKLENTSANDSKARATKAPMPIKTTSSKTGKSDAPPTPLVKKILNTGTFGTVMVKPPHTPASKPTITPSTTTTKPGAAPALRNSTSATSTATSKSTSSTAKPTNTTTTKPTTTMTTKPTVLNTRANTSALSSSTGPTRRQSIVPKLPLSSSTTTKPTTAIPPRTVVNPNLRSASPAPSNASLKSTGGSTVAARPRASVSEGLPNPPVRRPTTGPRPSAPTTASKPPAVSTARPIRTPGAGSISSLKEVKEDNSANAELQSKLADAEISVKEKSAAISELETQITTLRSSLESAFSEVENTRASIAELQQAKLNAEKELVDTKTALQSMRQDTDVALATFKQTQDALRVAQAESGARKELVEKLEAQIDALTSELKAVQGDLANLRASHAAASSDAAASAAIEHEALLKAQGDLKTIKAETDALKTTYTETIQAAEKRVEALQEQASRAAALEAEIVALTTEKEDTASRLSEAEVEVLELKDAAETAADELNAATARASALEEQLEAEMTARADAADEAAAHLESTVAGHAQQIEELNRLHEQTLSSMGEQQMKLVVQLNALQEDLAVAIARHDQTVKQAEASEQQHKARVEDIEKLHGDRQAALTANIETLSKELESQEARYAAKVTAVKTEHDQLLQEAFERAKTEAGFVHTQELQTLRSQSQATIEQITASHESNIQALRAEHEAALEVQIKALEKNISNQSLELKATQDDLSKAKASLSASVPELNALKAQLEEANQVAASIAAASSEENAAEVMRLNQELSIARDDLAALNDMLKFTKDSLTEMSQHHQSELESAARVRVEEVTKLSAAHDGEKSGLLQEKDTLLSRVSDLEGELATLRAAAAATAAQAPSARSNGVAHPPSPVISKEELQRMHEAHNLRLHDVEANHDRALRELKEELAIAQAKADDLNNEVSRKTMEIQYLEQDVEDKDDAITRLTEERDNARAKLDMTETQSKLADAR